MKERNRLNLSKVESGEEKEGVEYEVLMEQSLQWKKSIGNLYCKEGNGCIRIYATTEMKEVK